MRIMIDTNVIISAILFPDGRAAQAFLSVSDFLNTNGT